MFGASTLALFTIPARITDDCTTLMQALNEVRLNDLSTESDVKLQVLERALGNANRGQGIGFTFAGIVISPQTLRILVAKAWAFLAFILPFVWPSIIDSLSVAAGEDDTQSTSGCALTILQQQALQSTVSTFHNATCTYNVTLGYGGVVVW